MSVLFNEAMEACKLKITIAAVNHLQTLLYYVTLLALLIAVVLAITVFTTTASCLKRACRILQVKIKRSLSSPLQHPISEQSQDIGLLVIAINGGRSTSQMFSRAILGSRDHNHHKFQNSTLSRESVEPVQQKCTDKGELVVSTW